MGSRQVIPGLAVDKSAGRAYVVAAGSPVAEVTLPDLRVNYHNLVAPGRPPALLAWLRQAALAPAAEAKMQSGPERHALLLGDGKLAVWGRNMDFRGDDDSAAGESQPSGLQIIDTRDWSVRILDPDVSEVVDAKGRLVTSGTTTRMPAGGDSTTTGDGVRIRTPGPGRPVHVLPGRAIQWVQTYGSYAYVDLTDPNIGSGKPGYAVIDTRIGRVIGEHRGLLIPEILDGKVP